MQTIKLPLKGLIYVSTTDPTCKLFVEAVTHLEADEDADEGFCVECCDPADVGNPVGTFYEVFNEEWEQLQLKPLP